MSGSERHAAATDRVVCFGHFVVVLYPADSNYYSELKTSSGKKYAVTPILVMTLPGDMLPFLPGRGSGSCLHLFHDSFVVCGLEAEHLRSDPKGEKRCLFVPAFPDVYKEVRFLHALYQ